MNKQVVSRYESRPTDESMDKQVVSRYESRPTDESMNKQVVSRYESRPTDESMNKQATLKKGIQEFNDGDYFECHETLEDVWMIEMGPDRPFYQGLLQLSVGCFHLLNRNYVGAESQWSKAHTKLIAFGDQHLGVELKPLIEGILRCQEMLATVQSGQRKYFDLSIIPHIQSTM